MTLAYRMKKYAKEARRLPVEVKNLHEKISKIENQLEVLDRNITDVNTRVLRLRQFVPTVQISENTIIAKLFTELKIYLDPRDMAVAAHIALDGIWEKEITRAWLTLIEDNMNILDIGANFGYYGLLAGQFTNRKKSKIILFEANPNIIPYVNKSISINWLNETTRIENLAISSKSGSIELTVLKDYIGSSSVQSFEKLDTYMHEKMQLAVEEKIKVNTVSVDDYCEENHIKTVDLIKMDIEGYEEEAYKGMRQIVQDSPKATMFIEFTKEGYEDPEKFYEDMLDDFGYVYTIDHEGNIVKPKSSDYNIVIDKDSNWTMPIFSKIKDLHKRKNNITG